MQGCTVSRFLSVVQKEHRPAWSALRQLYLPLGLRTHCPLQPRITPLVAKRGATTTNKRLYINHDIRPVAEITRQHSFTQEVFNQSLALTHSRMNDGTELRCALFNANGSIVSPETRMTKSDVAKQYGIDMRDLRNADLVSEGSPHILVRPSTIFISIFSLRLLIQSDRVLLFLLDSENDEVKMQDIFEQNLQSRIRTDSGSDALPSLPYELRVVDAALASVTAVLEAEHLLLREEVGQRLRESQSHREEGVHSTLRELLDHRKRLVTIEQRSRQVRSALQELLNNDEDLATMYLSDQRAGKPHAIADHQEVEYLLEAYYKNADAIAESSSALGGNASRTAGAIESMLDVRRNQILILEAQLEIWMLGLAVPTFVAGLFGMNVINHFEESASAFAVLVSACAIGTTLIARYGMRRLKRVQKMQF
ncbi:Magnesium transporter MRS2/LPE10 [Penicillium riverlandense]|uniref:Magnesium transporter MRS2/LPE10 n=1 Tax=Penicillium riverlandense TaxID=1903569 RepID=UPI0025490743|nr:Magnesium transporter MRS2/LPE10 [Penicillium riverlandense]KAJ5812197.1 Magnesium transporter MRS2/LPE10 [Penicillium riverlandense]